MTPKPIQYKGFQSWLILDVEGERWVGRLYWTGPWPLGMPWNKERDLRAGRLWKSQSLDMQETVQHIQSVVDALLKEFDLPATYTPLIS